MTPPSSSDLVGPCHVAMQAVYAVEVEKSGRQCTSFPALNDILSDPLLKRSSFSSITPAGHVIRKYSNPGPHSLAMPTATPERRNLFNDAVVICYYLVKVCVDFDHWYAALWASPQRVGGAAPSSRGQDSAVAAAAKLLQEVRNPKHPKP